MEIIRKSVLKLKSFKTIDELKASGDSIIEIVDSLFVSALEELKEVVENMDSYSAEELESKATMFQDDNFMTPPEIGAEMERLESLPGGLEYLDSFTDELEKKMEPTMEEFGLYAQKLMDKLFGGMISGVEDAMHGMADAMGEMGKQMGQFDVEEEEELFGYDSENPDSSALLYDLYEARTLEDLDKEALNKFLEEELKYIYYELELLTDESFGGPMESDMERIAGWRQKVERFLPEMEKELERLGKDSDSSEKAEALLQELKSKYSPRITDINKFLSRVK